MLKLNRRWSLFGIVLCLGIMMCAFASGAETKPDVKSEVWKPLFDGETLDGWEVPVYGGDGEVTVKDKTIIIGAGASATGIRAKKFDAKTNYELRYEAMRPSYGDFFGTVTFPVDDTFCSFVLGGWGGATIGLSSINGMDASENQTNGYHSFREKTWYAVRVRVTDDRIGVWLRTIPSDTKPAEKDSNKKDNYEEKQVVDLDRKDAKLSIRWEMQAYRPLGFCTWCTTGHLRKIEFRKLVGEDEKP
ncbi:MAG: 3-keto-disaccharide hydrolase [Thermoguttaceae bacterium]